jgi:hypothetical protein
MYKIRITTDPDLTEDIKALIAPRYATQEEAQDNAIRMMAAPPFYSVSDWDSTKGNYGWLCWIPFKHEGNYGWLCWIPFKHEGKDVPRLCLVFVEEDKVDV